MKTLNGIIIYSYLNQLRNGSMEAMFFNGSNSFFSNLGKAIHGLPMTICAN